MKVVLIDDDPQVLSVLGKLLRRRGHEVMTFDSPLGCPIYTSGQDHCFPEGLCPDIIISDIDMPKVSGMKFIESVVQKGCKCRKLALISGKGLDHKESNRMAEIGIRFFTKPLNFQEFDTWLMPTAPVQ